MQFQRTNSGVPNTLASALGAFRRICRSAGIQAYYDDMPALDGKALSDVKDWLAQSELKDESLSDWYLEAENHFGIRSSEDDYFTSDGSV